HMADYFAHEFGCIDYLGDLIGSYVDGSAVRYPLRCQQQPLDNVVNIGEVSILLTRSPYLEGVLSEKGFSDKSDDRMAFVLSRPVYGEQSTGSALQSELLVVSLERHFAHELRPPILSVSQCRPLLEGIRHFL